jgi:hypothetical protein
MPRKVPGFQSRGPMGAPHQQLGEDASLLGKYWYSVPMEMRLVVPAA